ncbi:cation-translocating P-type ATPase [Limnohabitans sp.]|uniref:heavy metal translocating P-type ATPase n=1 Tax=Limnohabitans sp. TaxID=1907725 RepID=UPI00311E3F1C
MTDITSSTTGAPLTVAEEDRQAWQLLDEPQEWQVFSQTTPGKPECWSSSVVFEGMHCAACAITIEQALKAIPGVQEVQVSAASHRGRITWKESVTRPSQWMAAAAQAGYRALPANDVHAHERRRHEARQMVWRVSVAGMCMMQVMMYATPSYVTAPGEISPNLIGLLRWASWVLSLPVMVFSCKPFFVNAWRDLKQRQISMDLPVALGMLIAFVVSSLGTFDPEGLFGSEVYFDSLTMFVFFLLTGRWLELRMRDKTAGALEAVMNRLPDQVVRQVGDQWQRVSIRKLVVGDVIEVLPGQAFAGDGVLIAGHSEVDEALLTGESRPLTRGVGDAVIAGSHNLSGRVLVRITQVGAATRFAQIVNLMESASVTKPQVAVLADRWAKPFLWGVLIAASASAWYGWQQSPAHAVMVAVSVLVVTCPCALSLATPSAMLAAAGALARGGVLVRRLSALQRLTEVDTVIFDKTGTLTRDDFTVSSVHVRDGVSPQQAVFLASALARQSIHPVSRALVAYARQTMPAQDAALELQGFEEKSGQGLQARLQRDGQTMDLRLGSAAFCGAPALSSDQLQVSLADAHGWMATFELNEALREDAAAIVKSLQDKGLDVRILSGDGVAAVQRVARALHVESARGLCTPQDKLQQLQTLQKQGHRVAMVGDGLNDGPVLSGADVSFALGQAVPLAQAQADFVLLGGQLRDLLNAWQHSTLTMKIVRQNLVWALVYNLACIPLALLGMLPAWAAGLGMATSSLVVVLNALRLSTNAKQKNS